MISEWIVACSDNTPTHEKIDVWAKCWNCKRDVFEYRRFADVTFTKNDYHGETWHGVPDGWRVTHFMHIPEGPK